MKPAPARTNVVAARELIGELSLGQHLLVRDLDDVDQLAGDGARVVVGKVEPGGCRNTEPLDGEVLTFERSRLAVDVSQIGALNCQTSASARGYSVRSPGVSIADAISVSGIAKSAQGQPTPSCASRYARLQRRGQYPIGRRDRVQPEGIPRA